MTLYLNLFLLTHKAYTSFYTIARGDFFAFNSSVIQTKVNKMLSYRRETALQGALVLAKSRRLELGDNILRIL